MFSGPQAAAAGGVTYRQLHHWIAQGYITPSGPAPRANWSTFSPLSSKGIVRIFAPNIRNTRDAPGYPGFAMTTVSPG